MDEKNLNIFNISTTTTIKLWPSTSSSIAVNDDIELMDNHLQNLETKGYNNYWALLAFILVLCTAAGNILVCLAIAWERRLQNVTNYFLMSLAITDLMVAILVMPLGILTLVRGYFPLQSEHCLAWICLDVLFCTASIMHLCTISVDRYLSLRYPMRFGRNKTRRRVTLKIVFVWILSIAMSLPLSLMYSKDHASVLVDGTCQIPDPVYKLVGSIVCFYIPLGVMLLTYCLTVRLLARQRQNLGGTPSNGGWASGWLGQTPALERRCTWKRLLKANLASTVNHPHSGASTDTELSTLDTHELWLPDTSIPEPTPTTMTALHQFGAEMFKLSRGLETVGSSVILQDQTSLEENKNTNRIKEISSSSSPLLKTKKRLSSSPCQHRKRRASTSWSTKLPTTPPPTRRRFSSIPKSETISSDKLESLLKEIKSNRDSERHRGRKFTHFEQRNSRKKDPLELPPPCTCPYFGENTPHLNTHTTEVKIIPTTKNFRASTSPINDGDSSRLSISPSINPITTSTNSKSLSVLPTTSSPVRNLCYSKTNSVVTWDSRRYQRRGSSFGGARTSLLLAPTKPTATTSQSPLRRSATLRHHNNVINGDGSIEKSQKAPSSPCLLQRTTTIRSHHSRNSSVISRNSSRHGRIIRLEQKATKVLGVVFFTFVILWAPFFVLNLLPTVCGDCEAKISHWVFDVVTWLGYASSMVNPIFYTIFNKVFRQAFKKVLMCKYRQKSNWRPHR